LESTAGSGRRVASLIVRAWDGSCVRIGVVVGWGRKGREVVGLGWNRMLGIGRTAEEEERCQLGPKGSQGRIAEEERSRKEEVGRRAIG
jgi:hypothetical protein